MGLIDVDINSEWDPPVNDINSEESVRKPSIDDVKHEPIETHYVKNFPKGFPEWIKGAEPVQYDHILELINDFKCMQRMIRWYYRQFPDHLDEITILAITLSRARKLIDKLKQKYPFDPRYYQLFDGYAEPGVDDRLAPGA